MKPKTLTRLLAAGGLGGLAAIHWLPKRFLPFGNPVLSTVLLVGGLLVLHRNPLRLLYRDTKTAVNKGMQGIARGRADAAPIPELARES
jgi:hypothetical protein